MMTDPISDLLTRIRNANMVKHETVSIPSSKMKKSIVEILLKEGYIKNYESIADEKNHEAIKVELKYEDNNARVITGLKRISKPGLKVYAKKDEIPKVLGGLGIAILSTSKGIMTDKEARKLNVGGEVICYVW